MIDVNSTPLRTARNYGINDFKVDEKLIEKVKGPFENFTITSSEKVVVKEPAEFNFTTSLAPELDEQLREGNKNLEINFDSKNNVDAKLNFKFEGECDTLVSTIILNINTNASLVIKYEAEKKAYNNTRILVNLAENCNADIVIFSDLSNESAEFILVESNLEKNANLVINFLNFSSKTSIYRYFSNLNGERAAEKINSLYLGGENSRIDLNYISNLKFFGQKSEMEVVGALLSNASKNFKGTINFIKGAKDSVGSENEFCLLLSDAARSKALPMLLCGEETVDGKHSSSAGKVDEKLLFYIMSHGLTKAEALNLIVKAKFSKIINSLFDEELKVETLEKIDRKLNNYEL